MSDIIISNLLGEKHTIDILIFLYIFGSRSRTDIYDHTSYCQRMPQKLQMLERQGLIETKHGIDHKTMMETLTPAGAELAKSLILMEESVGGNIEEFKIRVLKDMLTGRDHLMPVPHIIRKLDDVRVRISRRNGCPSRGWPSPRTSGACPAEPA